MLAMSLAASAQLRLKQPWSDSMVLQSGCEAVVRGWADAGASVSVVTSWDGRKYVARAAYDGLFEVRVSTPAASYDKHSIRIVSGRESLEIKDVPVGMVVCAYGGSKVESWIPEEICETYPDIGTSPEDIAALQYDYYSPYMMYNAMLHPVAGYTVKGMLWYQGCSNVGNHDTYADRLGTMVRSWRNLWGGEELPFSHLRGIMASEVFRATVRRWRRHG